MSLVYKSVTKARFYDLEWQVRAFYEHVDIRDADGDVIFEDCCAVELFDPEHPELTFFTTEELIEAEWVDYVPMSWREVLHAVRGWMARHLW